MHSLVKRIASILDHPYLNRIGNFSTLTRVVGAGLLILTGLGVATFELLTHAGWVAEVLVWLGLLLLLTLGAPRLIGYLKHQAAPSHKTQSSRQPVGPIHEKHLREWLDQLANEVLRGNVCEYFDMPDSTANNNKRAIAAHFPDLRGPFDEWDQAVIRRDSAPALAEEKIRNALGNATFPPGYNVNVIANAFTRCMLQVGGPHRVVLKATNINEVWKVDTPSGQRNVAVNIAELPEAPIEDIQCQIREDEKTLQNIVAGIDTDRELADIKVSQEAIEALRQPLLDLLDLKRAISPMLTTMDCPYCMAQQQAHVVSSPS